MKRRMCLLSLILLLPAFAVAKPVRIAMSMTPLSAPFIVAQQHGLFARQGLSVEIIEVNGGHRAAQTLFSGEADIATSSEAVVMFNSFKRQDFVIFATFVNSDNDVKIIARRDSGIRTLSDLHGRRVGTILGTSAHFFLYHSLLLENINPDRVELVPLQPELGTDALFNKRMDAIAVWEPWAYQNQQKLGSAVVVIPHSKAYIETFNALTLRDYAQTHPGELRAIVAALTEATDIIAKQASATQTMVAARLGHDRREIEALWPDFNFSVNLHQWLLTMLEAEARWAIEQHLVIGSEVPNYLNFIWLPALESVNPNAISIFR